MCQLQAGDEVLSVNSQQVAEMSYTDWKSCMEEALQDGSLVMDVRRHGKNSESSEHRARVREADVNHFEAHIPGLTVPLTQRALLNSFDTLNWCVNYCEIIHEWFHDSETVKDPWGFFSSSNEEKLLLWGPLGLLVLPVRLFLPLFVHNLLVTSSFVSRSSLFPCGEPTQLRSTVLWVCCFHGVRATGFFCVSVTSQTW